LRVSIQTRGLSLYGLGAEGDDEGTFGLREFLKYAAARRTTPTTAMTAPAYNQNGSPVIELPPT